MRLSTRNQVPVAAGRAPDAFSGQAERAGDKPNPLKMKEDLVGASPDAILAARDLIFEGLIEAGSLAESYSRSLTEAAWRGDQSTVEVHLRQLRACVVAGIGMFKELDAVEAKGAGA